MNKHRSYTQADEIPVNDGDGGWVGVNDLLDPVQLEPGYCASAINLTFRNGLATPRLGIVALAQLNTVVASSPLPMFPVYGIGKFSDAQGEEWIIFAAQGAVFRLQYGVQPIQIIVAGDEQIQYPVEFVQCFNTLIMFRSETLSPLVMTSLEGGFKAIDLIPNTVTGPGTYNPLDGTQQIPSSTTGLFFANRLLVPYNRDLIAVSDYLNYTRYSPTLADFRINQGSADKLVSLYKFNESTILCFKDNSVWAVSNVYGDLSAIRQDLITSEYGLVAPKTVVSIGSDVWFLSQRGVASVTQTIQNKLQGVSGVISKDIGGTIARINWKYAHLSTSIYHDDKYYLAVPLDDASVVNVGGTINGVLNGSSFVGVNNAILVFDFITKAWSGIFMGPSVMVKSFILVNVAGKLRLAFHSEDGFICLMEETLSDCTRNISNQCIVPTEIETTIQTRAYKGNELLEDWRRWTGIEVDISTFNPKYSVSVIRDGVNESTSVIIDRTKSSTKYMYPYDKADWVASNVNNDFSTEGREDYAISGIGITDPGTGIQIGLNLLQPELHQSVKERYRISQSGRSIQVKLVGTRGRIILKSVKVAGRAGVRNYGTLS